MLCPVLLELAAGLARPSPPALARVEDLHLVELELKHRILARLVPRLILVSRLLLGELAHRLAQPGLARLRGCELRRQLIAASIAFASATASRAICSKS